MKKILLIGSSGFLGRVLYQHLSVPFEIIPTHTTHKVFENSEPYDFFHDNVQNLLEKYSPDCVIMAAAVEIDTDERFEARVQTFARACQSCYLVYVSSDALFDGRKGNYSETDPPSPITTYGRNLVYFEAQVQTHCYNFLIIRPSYLYGFSVGVLDSRLEKTRTHLNAGETMRYFDDMFKSPLEVTQTARVMTKLIEAKRTGIIHVAGERKSVYDFHLEAMQALGVNATNLKAVQLPKNSGLPRDTSLDISLMKQLENPHSISKSLAPYF